MNTTSITISTNPVVKTEIKKIAKKNNMSMSDVINLVLQKVIQDKTFVERLPEKPTAYLLKSIKTALQEKKQGKTSPRFTQSKEAIKWLNS